MVTWGVIGLAAVLIVVAFRSLAAGGSPRRDRPPEIGVGGEGAPGGHGGGHHGAGGGAHH
jgi:hypothetical protein